MKFWADQLYSDSGILMLHMYVALFNPSYTVSAWEQSRIIQTIMKPVKNQSSYQLTDN